MMKIILVDSLNTCTYKCINPANFQTDNINSYEKKCLSTCSDKYVQLYLEKLVQLRNAVFKNDHRVE